MPENTMFIIWAAAVIVFGVFEAVTAQLVSIWFVIGSIAALIAAILKAPVYLQVVVFIAVSIMALAITRPLVKKFIHPKKQRTNADRVIGQVGVVISEIDNINAVGDVKVDGKIWAARSQSGKILPPDTKVRINEISGVKLIVEELTAN